MIMAKPDNSCLRHGVDFEFVPRRMIGHTSYDKVWRCPQCVAEAKASVQRARNGYRRRQPGRDQSAHL